MSRSKQNIEAEVKTDFRSVKYNNLIVEEENIYLPAAQVDKVVADFVEDIDCVPIDWVVQDQEHQVVVDQYSIVVDQVVVDIVRDYIVQAVHLQHYFANHLRI